MANERGDFSAAEWATSACVLAQAATFGASSKNIVS